MTKQNLQKKDGKKKQGNAQYFPAGKTVKKGVKNASHFSLPEGWIEMTLGEVGKVITGKTPSKNNSEDWNGDVDFITPTDLKTDSKYILNTARNISKVGEERFERMLIPKNTVIVTCIGSDMGKVVLNKKKSLTNQQINSLIVSKKFDSDFIYYLLKNSYKILRQHAEGGGSTMPILNKTSFENLSFSIPSLSQQKAIAKMLSSFDDKIELLREQNETLEKIGQEIFKEWFGKYKVGDDEVNSDEGGREGALGQLPDGWRVGKLENLPGEIIRGFTTKYVEKSNLINLNQKVNKGKNLDKQYFKYYPNDTEVPKNKFIQKYDILLNSLGQGTLGRVHLYKEETDNVVADQHISILRFDDAFAFYVYQVLVSREGNFRLLNGISGSTGMLMLNIGMVRDFEIIIPPKEILEKFNQAINPMFEKIEDNSEQIQTLSKTRDTLLPKLMKGGDNFK